MSDLLWTDVIVNGEGPAPADGALIGQGPGADEVLMLTDYGLTPRPFIGQAGQELDEYLRQAGVARQSIYITNAYKRFLIGNRRPTIAELEEHLDILLAEIELAHPKVVGCVGDCSSAWISSLAGEPFRDMASEHGIPRKLKIPGVEGFIMVPLYHPAAGLRNPDSMGIIFSDFQVFGKILKGETALAPCTSPSPIQTYDLGRLSLPLIDRWGYETVLFWGKDALPFHGKPPHGIRVFVDTEGDTDCPWGLTYSLDGQSGWKIGAESPSALAFFNQQLHDLEATIVLHNSLHDIPVLRAMGVEVCDLPIIDTMILAYLLCVEPQGLKDLAWRHLRLSMREYADIADKVTETKALNYLAQAANVDWDACPRCGAAGKLGVRHLDRSAPFTQMFNEPMFTAGGNIKKKFLPYANWCKPEGVKVRRLNKRIARILATEES